MQVPRPCPRDTPCGHSSSCSCLCWDRLGAQHGSPGPGFPALFARGLAGGETPQRHRGVSALSEGTEPRQAQLINSGRLCPPEPPPGPGLGRRGEQTQGTEAGKGRSRTGFVQDINGAIPATEQIPAPGAGSRSGLTFQRPGERGAKEMICTQRSPCCHLSVCTCCHLCQPPQHPAGHPGTTANPRCPGPLQRQSSPILTLLHS